MILLRRKISIQLNKTLILVVQPMILGITDEKIAKLKQKLVKTLQLTILIMTIPINRKWVISLDKLDSHRNTQKGILIQNLLEKNGFKDND